MTREPEATTKTRQVRATFNQLFSKDLEEPIQGCFQRPLALSVRIAQARCTPSQNQPIACAEHRPANRPGVD
jgi:hypothetical protein